jgi:hypothetical protein
VLTRRTAHPTGFFAAFTSPALDIDASSQLGGAGALLEPGFTWVWHHALSEGCPQPGGGGEAPLVLDVGANFGYYSLLAAALGCRVLAWEPVPHFAAFFKYALLRNNFTRAVEVSGWGGGGGAPPRGCSAQAPPARRRMRARASCCLALAAAQPAAASPPSLTPPCLSHPSSLPLAAAGAHCEQLQRRAADDGGTAARHLGHRRHRRHEHRQVRAGTRCFS